MQSSCLTCVCVCVRACVCVGLSRHLTDAQREDMHEWRTPDSGVRHKRLTKEKWEAHLDSRPCKYLVPVTAKKVGGVVVGVGIAEDPDHTPVFQHAGVGQCTSRPNALSQAMIDASAPTLAAISGDTSAADVAKVSPPPAPPAPSTPTFLPGCSSWNLPLVKG